MLACAMLACVGMAGSSFAASPQAAKTPDRRAKPACVAQVQDGWLRLPPGRMPMLAGFGRIVNPCAKPIKVIAARSEAFASVELHESRIVDGVSRMRPVPVLRIAAGDAAVLKPGGLHLMLMRPSVPPTAGERVVVEFELADGSRLRGEFEVRKPQL